MEGFIHYSFDQIRKWIRHYKLSWYCKTEHNSKTIWKNDYWWFMLSSFSLDISLSARFQKDVFYYNKPDTSSPVVYRGFFHQQQTDVIYTDFSKAFDRVNHVLLSKKLYLMGFTNLSLKWIYSYITSRTQTVLFKTGCSRSIDVLSGVP